MYITYRMLGPPASKSLWPFSPQSIPGLSLWLDGADTSSMTFSSGTTVTAWRDKSSTGNNFTGSASYALDSEYNKYGLSFNGSSNYFSQVNGSLYSITNTTYTIFTVHRFYYNSPSNGVGEVYRQVGGTIWFRQQSAQVNWITDTTYIQISGTASSLSGIGCINTLTTSSATAYSNGTSVGSASRGTTTNIAFSIGRYSGGSELLQGAIFEMLVFNTTLSTSQQQQVEGYLAQKWGLQDSLPATHPYYAAVPSPGTVAVSSPTAISGLKLWLDAADASTVTGTTSVTAWADKSGTSNNMSVTSGTISYASNTMTFASGGIMSSANSTAVVGQQSVVFVVCQPTTIPGAGIGYVFVCSNISSGDYSIRFATTTSVYATNSGDLGYSPGAYYINGTFGVPSGGTITFPSTPNIIYGLFSTSGTTAFALSTSFLSRYFIGKLYEVIVYTGPITTSQRASVELYLSNKWGIAVTSTIPPTLATQLYQRPVFQRTFQPVDIPGLSLWLDAADLTSLTISSGNVTAWKDKSGNGYIATQSSLTSGSITKSTRNNLNVIAMNSQVMTIPSFSWTSFATMFFVVNTPSWFYCAGSSGYNGYVGSFNWGLYNFIGYPTFNDSVLPLGTQVIPTNQWCIFSIGYGGGTQASNYCVNGTSRSTTTITPVGNSTVVTPLWFSGRWDSTSGDNAIIAEIIHYNNELTTSQRQQVESYLAWKWGLVSSLPASPAHPGKLLPAFSTVFTPKSISGCQLWLDAADASSMTFSSGTTVSAWLDKSGNGNNGTANTGVAWAASGMGTNLPAMTFTNSQWFLGNISITGSTMTVFGVISMSASSPFAARMIALAAPNANDYNNPAYVGILRQSSNNMGPYRNGNYPSVTFSYNTPTLLSTWYDGTNANISANGALTPSSSASSGNFTISSYALAANTNLGDIGAASFYGYMSEIIIYNSSLSTSQRQQVEGYLSWKWGLQNNLPDTHAYKKFRP